MDSSDALLSLERNDSEIFPVELLKYRLPRVEAGLPDSWQRREVGKAGQPGHN